MRNTLNFLLKSCSIFDEVSPNELRVMLWLRLHELPCHISDMDLGISEKKIKEVVSEYKRKGFIGQRVSMGAISLTQKGNSYLDMLLVKISENA